MLGLAMFFVSLEAEAIQLKTAKSTKGGCFQRVRAPFVALPAVVFATGFIGNVV